MATGQSNPQKTESSMGLSYKKTADYWANIPATIDGVLGGFACLSDIDISGSKAFLDKVFALHNPPGTKLALDCGAGVGRVTKHLLVSRFDKVDILEQDKKFIDAAEELIGENNPKLGTLYHDGLQKFKFEKHKYYDVIWCQWVLCHINDCDIVAFLNKSRLALKENGIIVVKENINNENAIELDTQDSSIVRPRDHMIELFKDAHLNVVLTETQEDFPEELYPVLTFLLIPISREPVEIDNTRPVHKHNIFSSEISL